MSKKIPTLMGGFFSGDYGGRRYDAASLSTDRPGWGGGLRLASAPGRDGKRLEHTNDGDDPPWERIPPGCSAEWDLRAFCLYGQVGLYLYGMKVKASGEEGWLFTKESIE